MIPPELPPRKVESQIKLLDSAARSVLAGVFGRKLPPDLCLAEFFRANRQCGSRDRALIGSGVYALLRYWGLTRQLMPQEWRHNVEHGAVEFSHRELAALLYAAFYCDQPGAPVLPLLADVFKFPRLPVPGPGSPAERAAAVAKALGVTAEFAPENLLPDWIAAKLPPDLRGAFTAALGRRPPLWLRIHRESAACFAEFKAHTLRVTPAERIPGAAALHAPRLNLFSLDGYAKGYFEVQDLASQAIGLVCEVKPGDRVLDACAGAGGKALQLAALMHNKGVLIAGDIRENKLEELRRRARRAGLCNIQTRLHNGKLWRNFGLCDKVLLDVPCTGSGVWRRNPGMQWCFTEEMLNEHLQTQAEILEHFAPAVKPGGRLIYSTCSLFREENEAQIEAFLSRHEEFAPVEGLNPLTGKHDGACRRFSGAESDCDFMFAAVLERSAR